MKIIETIKKKWNKFINLKFIKTYKEEMIVIPILFIGFYYLNHFLVTYFPNSAFFDFFSEIETLIFKIISFAVAMWIAHIGLRVSFPKIYKYLTRNFYENFEKMCDEKKSEYVVKFILVFIIAAAIIFGGRA